MSGSGDRRGGSRAAGPDAREPRPDAAEAPRAAAPELPDDVVAADLDRTVRSRLRTLSKDNADGVARHLVMAGRLIDEEPELAYEHAQAAVRRAGRVDVVREAAAIAAYRTGRFAEALRELRTVRRLNGSDEHLPLMADCERGLGRPERAIALASDDSARALPPELQVEMAIVVSGARLDLAEPDAAVAVLSSPLVRSATGEARLRVAQALVVALQAAGREAEAERLDSTLPQEHATPDDDVLVYDLEDDQGVEDDVRLEDDQDDQDEGQEALANEERDEAPGSPGAVDAPTTEEGPA
ncbi:hypothetical protein [Actinotalea sp. Marseille-Q4924]|uniref:hypothetical protein n=1 Tax=Actinotalea sp. Marseille-Q4924 TaxID=2866571 RepID=UPI001CE424CC|nr:hypothetical protein [Actinotalea sp. Marseille-Q4924]